MESDFYSFFRVSVFYFLAVGYGRISVRYQISNPFIPRARKLTRRSREQRRMYTFN